MFIEDDTTSRETSRGARIMSMGKALFIYWCFGNGILAYRLGLLFICRWLLYSERRTLDKQHTNDALVGVSAPIKLICECGSYYN